MHRPGGTVTFPWFCPREAGQRCTGAVWTLNRTRVDLLQPHINAVPYFNPATKRATLTLIGLTLEMNGSHVEVRGRYPGTGLSQIVHHVGLLLVEGQYAIVVYGELHAWLISCLFIKVTVYQFTR